MKQTIINLIKAAVYIIVAIFVLLSLISYDPCDTSFRCSQINSSIHNATGIIGAHIAEGLFLSFGWSSYVLCLLALIWAAARFLEKPVPRAYVRILGTLILLVSLPVLLNLLGSQQADARFARSGLVGFVIADVLLKYFGHAGSLIIALGFVTLSSFVASEFLIFAFGKALFHKSAEVLSRVQQERSLSPQARQQGRPKMKTRPIAKSQKQESFDEAVPYFGEKAAPRPRPRIKIVNPAPVKKADTTKPVVQKVDYGDYQFPSLDLLKSPPPIEERETQDDLEASSQILEATLRDFGVETKVTQVNPGPVITRYELEPAPGVKVHRIVELSDDIALAMKAPSIRIVAPIPGKSRVGVEVPNSKSSVVYLKEILESTNFQSAESKLTLALGKEISGTPIVTDLSDMPHLLIAGTTGSGKTVCMNSIITSILFNASPDEVKFIMVDPKMVELALFNDLPHLLCPVLTDPKKVTAALNWVVSEMENRFKLLSKVGARNIDIYNEKIKELSDEEAIEKMPYLVVIIDELADLMLVASAQVENAITRLAQLSRAVGIHLILATQRPSVNVITGVIKANFPSRISFRVASKVDSRTVLDMNGADKLLGKGDLLFLKPGQHKPLRAQGSLIFDDELERAVTFIKKQRPAVYNQELMDAQEKKGFAGKTFERDELFDEAVKVIMLTKQASVSMLQRRLGLGYTRAARLIDMMEEEGIVGPYRGSKPREILIENEDDYIQEPEKEQESV